MPGQRVSQPPVLNRAQALLAQHQPQQAIDLLLSHGRALDPLQLHLALASAYALLPDILDARKEFDEAIRLAPDRADIHRQYACALMVLADLPAARLEFERAITLNPSDGESLYDLALLDAREDRTADAAALLERAIPLTHDRRLLHRDYRTAGQMYLLIQNWAAARRAFDQALALEKDAPADLLGLGSALEGLSLPKDAVPLLEKAVALDPKNALAWEQLGRSQTDLNNCSAAVIAYSHASELRPDNRSSLSHLIVALRTCGRRDEAWTVSQRLKAVVDGEVTLATNGFELQRLNAEAIAMEQDKNYQSAEQNYRTLTGMDPDNPIFHRNLGLVLCRQSKWPEGLAELKRALALDPDDLDSQHAFVAAESLHHEALHRDM